MQEKDRENIALFRFGLISPILNGQANRQKDYLAKICSQVHQVPYWGPKEYCPKTVEEWIRLYKREGFDGLKPKKRSDKGTSRIIPLNYRNISLSSGRSEKIYLYLCFMKP